MWKFYDLLLSLLFDKDSQFILGIKKNLYKILNISVHLSTSFYLKTDGQNEIVYQDIKRYFCTFVNYDQDEQAHKLLIAKFAINNN